MDGLGASHQVVTGKDGAYEIADVSPGTYILCSVKAGYSLTFFGSHGGVGSTVSLKVEAGKAKTGIDVQLLPPAFIAGTVFDASGQRLPFARVTLFTWQRYTPDPEVSPKGTYSANAQGDYHIDNLGADTFYVLAAPPLGQSAAKAGLGPDSRQSVFAYYPGAATLAQAIPLILRTGMPLAGIDIHLRATAAHAVHGTLAGGSGFQVNLLPTGKSIWSTLSFALPVASGQFRFDGIEPGAYEVIAVSPSGELYSRVHVDVGETDVDLMALAVQRSPTVKGSFIVEGGKQKVAEPAIVHLRPLETYPIWLPQGQSDTEGSFQIENVVPGRYTVDITHLQEWALLKEWHWGGKEVTDGSIDVAPAEDRRLEAVVSFTGGSEGGVVTDGAGKPMPLATVVTIPDGHGSPDEIYAELTGKDGTFLERNLPPGRYMVIAFTNFDLRKLNREFLAPFERYAERLEIHPLQRASVALRPMSATQ